MYSIAILIVITLSGLNANAQKLYIGARIGANLANESLQLNNNYYSPIPTYSSRTGFLGGGQVDFWFNNFFAISAQVLYDQKGTQQSSALNTDDVILNYFEIPILLKASMGIGNFYPYVCAGPSVGLFLSGSEKFSGTYTTENSPSPQTGDTTFAIDRSTMNTLDVSADIGAGVSFKMPSGVMLFLEATDAIGLVNIANSYGESVVKSQDIRLAAGILFPLN
jgi:hypothetical protein